MGSALASLANSTLQQVRRAEQLTTMKAISEHHLGSASFSKMLTSDTACATDATCKLNNARQQVQLWPRSFGRNVSGYECCGACHGCADHCTVRMPFRARASCLRAAERPSSLYIS